jgi:phenylalanyl-tRNA synthetase beta chain
MLDIDLTILQQLSAGLESRYVPIQRYPSSAFDLSVIVGLRELSGAIQKKLSGYAGTDLMSIEFQREYTGSPLPENVKSISYRLTVAAPDRTLSSDEVSAVRARIIDSMRSEGYELRV